MNKKKRVAVAELNPHLLCILCGGYYVDATTVIECLHTFCKSCIVRYLETSKFCPICDVLVHKTHPLLSIRPDKSLQNIVYKLIPNLFKNEMCKRKRFYSERVGAQPSSEEDGGEHAKTEYLIPSDSVSVALKPFLTENENNEDQDGFHTRYFNCPAGVTLGQLKRLLRAKFDLPDKHPVIISLSKDDVLEDKFTLTDVAYIKSWKKESPLVLYYKIYFNKRVKMEPWIEQRPIKIEERENCDLDEDLSMPKLESEIENLYVIDCEKRSIPKLSPIGELPSSSPSPVFLDTPSMSISPEIKSVVQSVSISKPNSLSVPTYKTIIPAPMRTVPDMVSFSSLGLSPVDSLSSRNCGYSYGIGLLANPNGAVPSLFPGSLVDPTNIAGTVLPFGLTLAPSLICAPSSVNNINASFPDQSNLTGVGGLNLHAVLNSTEPSNNLILSLSSLETTSVVPSVSSHPIPSVVACEPSSVSSLPVSKACKKPKLIRPKKCDKRPIVEEKEVQLTISESGVMIVNEGDKPSNQLPGLINPVYSEANELLTKIENGSLLSSDPYSEDSKESDISDGAEKLAQIKEEISCILNTLSDEAQNFTQITSNESQSSDLLVPSLPVVVPSIKAEVLSSITDKDMPRKDKQNASAESESSKKLVQKELHSLKKSLSGKDSKVDKDCNVSADIPDSTSYKVPPKSEPTKQTLKTITPSPSSNNEPLTAPLTNHVNATAFTPSQPNKELSKKKQGRKYSQPVGYKTLKVSPRGWNPTISRENLHKKICSTSKPSKFFKARNSAILSSISENPSCTGTSGQNTSSTEAIKSNESGTSGNSSPSKDSSSRRDTIRSENVNSNTFQLDAVKRSSESTKLNKTPDNNNKQVTPRDNSLSKNLSILTKHNFVSTNTKISSFTTDENTSKVLTKKFSAVEKTGNSVHEIPRKNTITATPSVSNAPPRNSKFNNDVKVSTTQKSSHLEVGRISEGTLALPDGNKTGLHNSKNRSIAKAISYLHTKVDSNDVLDKKYLSPTFVNTTSSSPHDVKCAANDPISTSSSKGFYSTESTPVKTNLISSPSENNMCATKAKLSASLPVPLIMGTTEMNTSSPASYCTDIPKPAILSESDKKQGKNLSPKRSLESVVSHVLTTFESNTSINMKTLETKKETLKHKINKPSKSSSIVSTMSSNSASNNYTQNKHVMSSSSKIFTKNVQATVSDSPMPMEVGKKLKSQVDDKISKDRIPNASAVKLKDIPLQSIPVCNKVDGSGIQQHLASPADSASDKENKSVKEEGKDLKQNSSVTKESGINICGENPLHDTNQTLEIFSNKISKSASNEVGTSVSSDLIKSMTNEISREIDLDVQHKTSQSPQKFPSDTLNALSQLHSVILDGQVKSTLSSPLSTKPNLQTNIGDNDKGTNSSQALSTSQSSYNPVVTPLSILSNNNKAQEIQIKEKTYPNTTAISSIKGSDSIISVPSISQNVCTTKASAVVATSAVTQSTFTLSNSSIASNKLVYQAAESAKYAVEHAQIQNSSSHVPSVTSAEASTPSSSNEICKEIQKAITTVAAVPSSILTAGSYNTLCQFPITSKNCHANSSSTPLTYTTSVATDALVSSSSCAHTHSKESTVKNGTISHTTSALTNTSTSDKSQYSSSVAVASNPNTQLTVHNSYSASEPTQISSSSLQVSNSSLCSVATVSSNTQEVSKTVSSSQCLFPSINMENSLTATDNSRLPQNAASHLNSNSLPIPQTSSQNMQFEGNSGLSSYPQNNCGGEGYYFGNSFQNGSFPFFNNFMPFANGSLPYATPLNSYGNTATSSSTSQARSKLLSGSCSDYSKIANTAYSVTNSTTPVDSSQNNSFLSYPTISSVPPTLQDTSKFIQNLLGSSVPNVGSDQQKTNLKSSVEELDRLLFQTISSSVADNKMVDFFSSGSASSNDGNKTDKSHKDVALSNSAVETPVKQNLQTSNVVSTVPIKVTNSESTTSVTMSLEHSPAKVNAKGIPCNKEKETPRQIPHDISKVAIPSSSSSSSSSDISFNNVLTNSSNIQKSSTEYSGHVPAISSQAYTAPTTTAVETYKPVYHQSQCCNHQNDVVSSLSNVSSSVKGVANGSNFQQNKANDHVNASTLPNIKKNIMAEKTSQAVSSSSYGAYTETSQYNSSAMTSTNTIESNGNKKNHRPSGCANGTAAAVTANSVMNTFHEGMPCISSNASTSHKHVSQTGSWDVNSLNPFLFNNNNNNNNGDAYGCVPAATTAYKSGFPSNSNSCIQQNMFRNNTSSSAMSVKDNTMNTHSQTNFNSSTNLSCSPKTSLAINPQYSSDNTKKGISNAVENYDNFSVGSQKYNPSHASLYYSNYNNNYANFFSNSQGQSSPSLTSFVSGAGYNFPLSGSKFPSGQQYLNFSQNNPNNSYFSSAGNFNVNSGSNYQNCINQSPSSNTGGSNTNSNLGNNFSGPLCNISLPYYSNCSFSYNSYPYFYQGDMSLLSPTASFMPPFSCLPSRPSLSSRNSSPSQSFNDFSLQSGFFPMMPFVSPLQGNGARATPSPMTGGISSSFGARSFPSNYSQKQIAHDTSKLSQKTEQQSPKSGNASGNGSSNKSKHRKTNGTSKHKSSSSKELESKLPKAAALTVPAFTPSGGIMSSGSSTTVNRIPPSTDEGNNNALTEGNRNAVSVDNRQQKRKDISPHVN